jgi:hypothetical protein
MQHVPNRLIKDHVRQSLSGDEGELLTLMTEVGGCYTSSTTQLVSGEWVIGSG